MGEFAFHLFIELAKERDRMDACLEVVVKEIKARYKLLKDTFDDRNQQVDGIAQLLFMLSYKAKVPPISKQYHEDIWGIMGYEWTPKNEQALKDACLKMALQTQGR
jgi:hypothetical protein